VELDLTQIGRDKNIHHKQIPKEEEPQAKIIMHKINITLRMPPLATRCKTEEVATTLLSIILKMPLNGEISEIEGYIFNFNNL